jgi:hypothetical protein
MESPTLDLSQRFPASDSRLTDRLSDHPPHLAMRVQHALQATMAISHELDQPLGIPGHLADPFISVLRIPASFGLS